MVQPWQALHRTLRQMQQLDWHAGCAHAAESSVIRLQTGTLQPSHDMGSLLRQRSKLHSLTDSHKGMHMAGRRHA